MTAPRCHRPNQVVFITRRCSERRFFLRPDRDINTVIPFELARGNRNADLSIHGALVMSNHIHLVVTDLTGERSDVMRDFLSGVGRARNCELGRGGGDPLWDSRPFSEPVLGTPADVERELLYTWLNPVKAGLVRRAEDWPGFKVLPRDWGKRVRVELPPNKFYRRNGRVFEFTPVPPPGFEHLSLPEAIEYFEAKLRAAEDAVIARMRRAARKFRGPSWVTAQSPFRRPRSRVPLRTISPRWASTDLVWKREAEAAHYEFQNEYARCRRAWLAGDRSVVFPAGTIQLRRLAPITCRPPRTDHPGTFRRA